METTLPQFTSGPAHAALRDRGQRAHLSGLSAEERIERAYLDRGCVLLARRWRGGEGEIDLIFRRGDLLVFVEVKSSSSFARAIESLHWSQVARIQSAAEAFVGVHPELALLDMRVDLAALDGMGRFRVIPNITM
ncbi:YraN family protein [Dinoroseobacter sp. S76]|uniref:YraN family protein n=1 Tax=Dinoroseobacter sp. S76 TaxID=3415124 RepID=UPI003C7C2A76